jgi:hypothetical protein
MEDLDPSLEGAEKSDELTILARARITTKTVPSRACSSRSLRERQRVQELERIFLGDDVLAASIRRGCANARTLRTRLGRRGSKLVSKLWATPP